MKKTSKEELRPEYDFASMKGGVRGKYADRYAKGADIILLDDDVAEVFHDAGAVNDALRSLIKIARMKNEVGGMREKSKKVDRQLKDGVIQQITSVPGRFCSC